MAVLDRPASGAARDDYRGGDEVLSDRRLREIVLRSPAPNFADLLAAICAPCSCQEGGEGKPDSICDSGPVDLDWIYSWARDRIGSFRTSKRRASRGSSG
jgi:hypothetical protein